MYGTWHGLHYIYGFQFRGEHAKVNMSEVSQCQVKDANKQTLKRVGPLQPTMVVSCFPETFPIIEKVYRGEWRGRRSSKSKRKRKPHINRETDEGQVNINFVIPGAACTGTALHVIISSLNSIDFSIKWWWYVSVANVICSPVIIMGSRWAPVLMVRPTKSKADQVFWRGRFSLLNFFFERSQE